VEKVNSAISDFDGESTIFFVPPHEIEAHSLPWWIAGCNSIREPHPTVIQHLSGIGKEELIVERVIRVISPPSLIQQFRVSGLKLLKVDAEGHDWVILNAWLDAVEDLEVQLPHRILFEDNELTEKHHTTKLCLRLLRIGYELGRSGANISARLCDGRE